MGATVTITGLDELQRFLDTLAPRIQSNIMRSALRQGANVIKDEAKANLESNDSVKTGRLEAGLKVSTRSSGMLVTAKLQVKGKHGYIAHWIEYGVAAHTIKAKNKIALSFGGMFYKSVDHPGFSPKPFMRPALDGKAAEAVIAVGEAIKEKLTLQGIDATDTEIDEE